MATVFARSGRQELLGLLNLAVYISLGCLAVAAQTHAALAGPTNQVGNLVLLDHGVAAALLTLMVRTAIRRLKQIAV
jgi:hypothetical protein